MYILYVQMMYYVILRFTYFKDGVQYINQCLHLYEQYCGCMVGVKGGLVKYENDSVILSNQCNCDIYNKQQLSSLAAVVQVQFDPENYNVTEGEVVNITLVTSTRNYEFDFNVTLLYVDGTATGEPCS